MATKNISTYPVVETIKDADKVVLSKDGTVRLVEIGTVKADMRQEIRDAKGELQNELNSKTSATEAALDAERTARTNADTALAKRVDDEVEARTNANADLQESIDAEETARENADTNLQTQIDNRYTKTETDDLLDAKQDNLSESQLAATNSGLTSNDKTALDLLVKILNGTGPGFHSSIYRGKYLGDTYTDEQKQAIASGTFEDLFVGDYWTINGVNWRIADFDYYYNIGDRAFTKHHVIIVPDTTLYGAQMNSENTSSGGYTNSEMYTTNLDEARAAFDNAFGSSFIPSHRGMYSNATSSGGNPSGFTWRDMRVELMNEEQLYGHAIWGSANHNGYDTGTQKTQFKLFVFDQTKINIRELYWLANVSSSSGFARIGDNGLSNSGNASDVRGVRPFACLVGDSE